LFHIGLIADQRSKEFLAVGLVDCFYELLPASFLFDRRGLCQERLQRCFHLCELASGLIELRSPGSLSENGGHDPVPCVQFSVGLRERNRA
jgi:hypothetical protein